MTAVTGGTAKKVLEFRAGVVFYGGVSLAVYMGGVAQEFLTAVRASKLGEPNHYHQLLTTLGADFIVDVISGTSAGGINGVFLARALTTGGSLDELFKLWKEEGDFALLSDWEGRQPNSVLNGDYFLRRLEAAMAGVGTQAGRSLVPALDLHVTATDLHGRYWKREDALGHMVLGRNHRQVFHLKYRQKFSLRGQTARLGYEQNDFSDYQGKGWEETTRFLARLARTTAAFPGAFAPMDHPPADVPRQPEELPDGREQIWYTDGGVLQNRPFEPALKTIFERAADVPVERLLFYVEPVLEDKQVLDDTARSVQPDALQVVRASLLDLPSYQAIGQHLKEIDEHNARVEHLKTVLAELEADIGKAQPVRRGPAYTAYLKLRCGELTRDLQARLGKALTAATAAGQEQSPVEYLRRRQAEIDQAVQTLADFIGDRVEAEGLETFLSRYDLSFEQRRLHYLVEQCSGLYGRQNSGRADLPTGWEQRVLTLEAVLWRALEALRTREWFVWNPPSADDKEGLSLWHKPQPWTADVIMGAVGEAHTKWSSEQSILVTAALSELTAWGIEVAPEEPPDFTAMQQGFADRDLLLFPLQVGTALGERDSISWVRISPYDADTVFRSNQLSPQRMPYDMRLAAGRQKIAGDSLANFGGFLSWRWRANDYMWGRLDAVDLIIAHIVAAADKSGRYQDEMKLVRETAAAARLEAFRTILKENLHEYGREQLAAFMDRQLELRVQGRLERIPALADQLRQALRRLESPPAIPPTSTAVPAVALRHAAAGASGEPDPWLTATAWELADLLERCKGDAERFEWPPGFADEMAQTVDLLRELARTGAVTAQTEMVVSRLTIPMKEAAAARMYAPYLAEIRPALLRSQPYVTPQGATAGIGASDDRLFARMDWEDMHTFLTRHYTTGGESVKDLHPGVVAHVGIDVAENLRQVVGGIIAKTGRPTPPLMHKAAQVVGYPIQWLAKVVKPLIPRPRPLADDRRPADVRQAVMMAPLLVVAFGYVTNRYGHSGAVVGAAAVGLLGFLAWAGYRWRKQGAAPDLSWAPTAFWSWGLLLVILGFAPALEQSIPGTMVTPLELAKTFGLGMMGLYLLFSLSLIITRPFGPSRGLHAHQTWPQRGVRLASAAGLWALRLAVLLTGLIVLALLAGVAQYQILAAGLPSAQTAHVTAKRVGAPGPEPAGFPPEGIAQAEGGALLVSTLDGYVLKQNEQARGELKWEPLGERFGTAANPGVVTGLSRTVRAGKEELFALAMTCRSCDGGLYEWDGRTWQLRQTIPGSPNGLAVYGDNVYVSTEPRGMQVFHLRREPTGFTQPQALPGTVIGSRWAAPNGLAIQAVKGANGATELNLLVAEMLSGALYQLPLDESGELRSTPGGKGIERTRLDRLPGFLDGIAALSDGRIAVSNNEGFIFLFDPQVGKTTAALKIPDRSRSAANLMQQGDQLAFAAIGQVDLWGALVKARAFPGNEVGWVSIPKRR